MKKEVDRILENTNYNLFDKWDYPETLLAEFDIHEYITIGSERLKKHWFHSWICTDTQVGIAVYTLDGYPVCISFQQYRKSSEEFWFLSQERADKLKQYLYSLIDRDLSYRFVDELPDLDSIVENTDHKKFEKINDILVQG